MLSSMGIAQGAGRLFSCVLAIPLRKKPVLAIGRAELDGCFCTCLTVSVQKGVQHQWSLEEAAV